MSKLFKFRGGGKSQRTSTPIRHSQTTKVSSFDKSHCTTGHDEPDTTYRPESSQAFSECLRTRQTQPFITILICIRTGHLIIPSSSRLFFFSLSGVASLNGASCCGLQTNSESIALKDTQLTGFGALKPKRCVAFSLLQFVSHYCSSWKVGSPSDRRLDS